MPVVRLVRAKGGSRSNLQSNGLNQVDSVLPADVVASWTPAEE